MADHEKVYSVRFDVAKAQAALGKFNKRLERSIKLVSKLEHTGKRTFRAFAQGYKKMERGAERVNRSTRKIGKTALNASKQIEKAARRSNKGFDSMGKRASRLGSTLTRRLSLPIAIAGIASMKFAVDFNKGMANVATLTDGSLERVTALKEGVQALATDTGKATGDLADGLYQVISALGDTDRSMGQLDIASRAAVAGVSTTKESISLLSGVMNAYNETTVDQMKATSDLAFTAVKLGVTTYPELATSMGRVTPLAAAMGTSQAELFATMAAGTKVGTATAEVATQVASVYSAMLKPTEKLQKVTKKLGFESATAMMKELGFRDTLIALNEAVGGNEEAMAKMLKRKEATLIATVLLGGQSENYTKILGEMKGAVGATDEAYRIQTEGINAQGHSWEKTKQRMMVFAQRLGDKLLPIMERFFTALEPILEKLEKMDDSTLEWGIKIAGLLMILGPGLKIFGGLATVFGAIKVGALGIVSTSSAMSSFFTTQGANAATLTGKMGLLAKSLGAVAAAAAAGYAVGSVISETIVAPEMKKKSKREDTEENIVRRAKDAVKHGSIKEKEAARKKLLQHYGGKMAQGQSAFQIDDPLETLASKIVGAESPEQAQKRRLKEGAFAVKQLNYQLPKAYQEAGRTGRASIAATESVMGYTPGKQRRGEQGVTINNSISVPGGDPVQVERVVKKVMKQTAKDISRGAAGIGATDQ